MRCLNVFDHTEGGAETGDRDEPYSSRFNVVPRGSNSPSINLSHGLIFTLFFSSAYHVRRFVGVAGHVAGRFQLLSFDITLFLNSRACSGTEHVAKPIRI